MMQLSNAISSIGATHYVDAFTTGEILGFVVLIICTQIVITWIAVYLIRRRIICTAAVLESSTDRRFASLAEYIHEEFKNQSSMITEQFIVLDKIIKEAI